MCRPSGLPSGLLKSIPNDGPEGDTMCRLNAYDEVQLDQWLKRLIEYGKRAREYFDVKKCCNLPAQNLYLFWREPKMGGFGCRVRTEQWVPFGVKLHATRT